MILNMQIRLVLFSLTKCIFVDLFNRFAVFSCWCLQKTKITQESLQIWHVQFSLLFALAHSKTVSMALHGCLALWSIWCQLFA